MDRFEHLRKKIHKNIRRVGRGFRGSVRSRQGEDRFLDDGSRRLNHVLKVSLVVAVALVLVLSAVKILRMYSEKQTDSVGEQGGGVMDVPEVVSAAAAEPVDAQPVPTPRPKAVALTFDDGPSRANDGKILDVLQKHGAHATFFVVGDRARVDGDIMQMMLAAGCEIGSHSWSHPMLSKMKWKKVRSQIDRTDRIVKKLANGYQINLLRPPYGAISKKMRKKLEKPMVLWSLDTLDWKTRDAGKVFRKVRKKVSDGDIILMHDIHAETAEAITKVVPWLQKEGYDILTVSELMARKGKTMEAGKAYCDAK